MGREDEVTAALKYIEPRLNDLVVLATAGSTSIAGDIGLGRRIPISQMGQGVGRLLSIVCSIIDNEGGGLLVDEIENGLHYGVLRHVWEVVLRSAERYDVQIFATTHSLEAIEAAVEATEGHEGSLAFYRLDRVGSDIKVVEGNDSRLRSAVKVGYEIR